MQAGAPGVLLITMTSPSRRSCQSSAAPGTGSPRPGSGVNFLVTGKDAFPILGALQREGVKIDAYWADTPA